MFWNQAGHAPLHHSLLGFADVQRDAEQDHIREYLEKVPLAARPFLFQICSPENSLFCQFLLESSSLPAVISAVQISDTPALLFNTSLSLGKDVVNMLQLSSRSGRGQCLKNWAVIGRHSSWRLSFLGSHWSEQIYSICVHRLDYSIDVQQYSWSKLSVCTTSVCM